VKEEGREWKFGHSQHVEKKGMMQTRTHGEEAKINRDHGQNFPICDEFDDAVQSFKT
jgi:hypothetical protein